MPSLNFRTLDLNLLRVFDEVMAERNLTRAAEKLAITQPAVSNALRRLREAVGDELLVRSGHGVEPTPRALALWPAVRQALGQLQESLAPGGFEPASAQATFVLAMADATGATLIPPLIEITEREAPGISLRVIPLTTRDPRRLLDDGTIDMAVGYFPAVLADLTARAQADNVVAHESVRLYASQYVCVMRAGHPLADAPLSLDQYCAAHHLLVSFSGKPYGFIDEALAALGRERRIVLTVNQFFTAGRVVATTDLLTVLPLHFVGLADVGGDLVWRPLPMPLPTVHVDALWHRRRLYDPAHRWLRETIARAARNTPTPITLRD
ncbi:LysR family transcriptional regulator [Alicycliphilus denitrificans]|uniref:Transcriptional regulator, LysR family n=2 Tax=Alicycliphilus denitrificans TaxID=179636 RepID=F4GCT6_ALIDK|nr:LysR family transcriptional regulator [Alicycliphilus denitrificans]GAO21057.1 LysR family transcriptional regulator [Alicycliphilus sp. B1]ADU97896.1 LysR substrate-binding protein [Alicycliphilus denitrificans BC]AEB82539.1 transcriptional regulator, LysR family [Alicycliphilus denitrificans K601]QKD42223.1 LysR family transcriptional regulator [Alicycliphilus denitrificans]GAO25824.1 LysR family transcriptional regulator [Alicycliphilus sp. B1]